MEISKQQFVSVQLSYEETRQVLENYVRQFVCLQGNPLNQYKVEDYDPDTSRSGGEKGAFFLFLKED